MFDYGERAVGCLVIDHTDVHFIGATLDCLGYSSIELVDHGMLGIVTRGIVCHLDIVLLEGCE